MILGREALDDCGDKVQGLRARRWLEERSLGAVPKVEWREKVDSGTAETVERWSQTDIRCYQG